LLDKKSAIYSDRPDMFIGQKIASGNLRLVVMVIETANCKPPDVSDGLTISAEIW
jgi:hypothetical protein